MTVYVDTFTGARYDAITLDMCAMYPRVGTR